MGNTTVIAIVVVVYFGAASVAPRFFEHFCGRRVVAFPSKLERGSKARRVVNVGAGSEQHLDYVGMPVVCCNEEGSLAVVLLLVHLCAGSQQKLDDFGVPVRRSNMNTPQNVRFGQHSTLVKNF